MKKIMRRLFITSLFLLVTAGSFAQGTNDQKESIRDKMLKIMNKRASLLLRTTARLSPSLSMPHTVATTTLL